jgi:Holliday junction resolvase RusA-like endonuclease
MPSLFTFVQLAEPLPKARVRFGRGRTFTPDQTRRAEQAMVWRLKAAIVDRERYEKRMVRFFSQPVAVALAFYRSTRIAVDEDNLKKLVYDACTRAGLWKDDRQVKASAVFMHVDELQPRTVMAVCVYRGA